MPDGSACKDNRTLIENVGHMPLLERLEAVLTSSASPQETVH